LPQNDKFVNTMQFLYLLAAVMGTFIQLKATSLTIS
jgi:hypothetical protein